MKKKISFVFALSLIGLFSCQESEPTLCDCLTNSEYSSPGTQKYEQCKKVFKKKYGSEEPSLDTMRGDYYNCKN